MHPFAHHHYVQISWQQLLLLLAVHSVIYPCVSQSSVYAAVTGFTRHRHSVLPFSLE